LLPTIALALLMLSVTGLVGSPLLPLVVLDLGICYGFFLFERFTQEPTLHILLFQLDLMVVENAVEGSGAIFGELTPFRVELTRVVRTLASSIRPALDIGEPFFQSSTFLGGLRILHRPFAIPMIGIEPQRQQEIADDVFLRCPALRVGLGKFDCIHCRSCRHDGNELGSG
jgi:hypothetical protein